MDIWMEQALGIASGQPSPAGWRAMSEALERLPQLGAEEIREIDEALSGWPDDLRATMCGTSWDDKLFAGEEDARLALFRYLRYDATHIGRYGGIMMRSPPISRTHLRSLSRTSSASSLTRINLSYQRGLGAAIGELSRAPLDKLAILELRGCALGDSGASALAGCSWLPHVEEIDLSSSEIGPEGLSALLRAIPSCRALSLSSNPVGDRGLTAIVEAWLAGNLPSLQILRLGDCKITSAGVRALGRAPIPLLTLDLSSNTLDTASVETISSLATLTTLSLSNAQLEGQSLAPLARSALRTLDASGLSLGDSGAVALGEVLPGSLEHLSLREDRIGGAGIAALLRCPSLVKLELGSWSPSKIPGSGPLSPFPRSEPSSRLTDLRCDHLPLGEDSAVALIGACPSLERLSMCGAGLGWLASAALCANAASFVSLRIGENPLGADGVRQIAGGRWERLETLSLSQTRATDEGLTALCQAYLPCLRELFLDGCALGDTSVCQLASSPVTRRLVRLLLGRNSLTAASVEALVASPYLGHLEMIDIGNNAIDAAGMDALAAWKGPYYISAHDNPGYRDSLSLPISCCP